MSKNRRGAPSGNNNAGKNKIWTLAIQKALLKRSKGDQMAALVGLAEKLLAKCAKGDMTALKELGDRLEGKVPQAIEGTGENGELSVALTIRYVDGNRSGPPEKT
mgnify:FL=1